MPPACQETHATQCAHGTCTPPAPPSACMLLPQWRVDEQTENARSTPVHTYLHHRQHARVAKVRLAGVLLPAVRRVLQRAGRARRCSCVVHCTRNKREEGARGSDDAVGAMLQLVRFLNNMPLSRDRPKAGCNGSMDPACTASMHTVPVRQGAPPCPKPQARLLSFRYPPTSLAYMVQFLLAPHPYAPKLTHTGPHVHTHRNTDRVGIYGPTFAQRQRPVLQAVAQLHPATPPSLPAHTRTHLIGVHGPVLSQHQRPPLHAVAPRAAARRLPTEGRLVAVRGHTAGAEGGVVPLADPAGL